MDVKCSYKQLVNVNELKPHPKNPNKHPNEQVERIKRSFKVYGIRHPIIVNSQSGLMVAGHGRLMAAKELNMKEFPVDFQEFENETEERKFLIADNGTQEGAELDKSQINLDIIDIGPFPIEDLCLEDFKVDVSELDTPPPEKKEKKCPNCGEIIK